jgi:phosphatidylinositol alpha-1,6-mannosyltransferase
MTPNPEPSTASGTEPSPVVFVMTGACSLPGGIAAVNLSLLTALVRMVESGAIHLTVESLLEDQRDRPPVLPPSIRFRGHRASKRSLAIATLRHALGRSLMFYERVGLAAATAPLAKLGLLRSVLFAHGWENWRNVRRVDLWSLRGADLVLTNSSYTLRRMQAYPALRGRFRGLACPLGLAEAFPLNAEPPELPTVPLRFPASDGVEVELGSQVLLLVGRMDPTEREKGHDQLIEALPAVLERHPQAQLVFVGPGDDRARLEEAARRSGIGRSVVFPGHVSAETLRRIYAQCYAFVMPSRQEGFGLVYLEAMNYAKPCLGCRQDGAEDVIADGETGVLIDDPRDIPELASQLIQLLGDPDAAGAMGIAGFRRLREQFTAEQFRARFITTFASELAR